MQFGHYSGFVVLLAFRNVYLPRACDFFIEYFSKTQEITHLHHQRYILRTLLMKRCLSWTPGGRRLLTGNQEGEFTLWDGTNFSFELIMSAHDKSFRCMAWSHNQNYLLTSDSGGNIKYWSPPLLLYRVLIAMMVKQFKH
mmetsp:Transcript_4868/g.10179  ORF Transcript_4868/g.10179 Transcript_4868/m.10179 type:complete len:140 (-) Transcript_4868:1001-1420(-)